MRVGVKQGWLALAAVAAVQSGVLAYMVYDRVSLLKSGREITIDVVPVDPRSLFRGDYVILNYPLSQVPLDASNELPRPGEIVYVTIAKRNDGWETVAVGDRHPGEAGEERAVLKGRIERSWVGGGGGERRAQARVRYGIESYFVPEGEGKELERQVRDRKIAALVAVGRDGTAAIKGLVVDGETVYVEPIL